MNNTASVSRIIVSVNVYKKLVSKQAPSRAPLMSGLTGRGEAGTHARHVSSSAIFQPVTCLHVSSCS